MTLTTPRGPESTVVRMVANAMHVANIEVETGWTRDEIKAVAIRDGYALDAATQRFRRAPRPKPASPGIVRTSQTSTGAEVASPGFGESEGLALSDDLPGAVAIASPSARLVQTPAASSPEPDPFAAAGAAFADLLRAIALALNADPAVPITHVVAPKPEPKPRLTHGASQSQIRQWARANGIPVNDRGTVLARRRRRLRRRTPREHRMNISEAVAAQNLAAFIAGDVDHCDEKTRRGLADDLALLEARSHKALGAGVARTADWWDQALALVTFEEA